VVAGAYDAGARLALRRVRGLWALRGGRDPAPVLAGRRAALDRRPLYLSGVSIVGQIAQYLSTPGSPPLRVVLYSLVALVAGLCYLGGTLQGWEHLTGREPSDESGRRNI
jgi:hypothetical protein